jgi:lipopolysaccharide/colanic/teichoic acid biosynthesis glycosyltransferase
MQNKAKQSTKNGHHNNNNNKATNAKQSKAKQALSLSLSLSLSLLFVSCLLACLIVATLPLSWWIALHPLSPTKLLQDPEETIASS